MTAVLEDLPEARAALESGELSLAQVQELVKTEAECPGSAAELLGVAKEQSLKSLKEQARDRRVSTLDPEELHSATAPGQDIPALAHPTRQRRLLRRASA